VPDRKNECITHHHEEFLRKARKRPGFSDAYDALEGEYQLARELLSARMRAGLTQEQVAEAMGTTKSSVSRLESAGLHSPSFATLKKYADAVGCELEIHLIPAPRRTKPANGRRERSVQQSWDATRQHWGAGWADEECFRQVPAGKDWWQWNMKWSFTGVKKTGRLS
jgi:transcriptional regulator with XRE-family HTH domain